MAKRRVYYYPDGQIVVLQPSGIKLDNETKDEFFIRQIEKSFYHKQGLDYDDIDTSQLPVDAERDKWRGSKGNGIHIDNTIVTVREKRQKVEDDLDTELVKSNPNAIKAIKLQRKLDKREYD